MIDQYNFLKTIYESGGISNIELSKKFNVSSVAISKKIKYLKDKKIVIIEDCNKNTQKGRPRKLIKINEKMGSIIGINVGSDFISVCVTDLVGNIIEANFKKFFLKTKKSLINILFQILGQYIPKYANIIAIGLAVNGVVDYDRQIVKFSPFIKWKNLDLARIVEQEFNIPTIVDNDVRLMLLAEKKFGVAKTLKNVFYLYMKNGIGGAILLDNKIYYGSNSQAGEIGHYILEKYSNRVCKCGKTGCIEVLYSENSIKNILMSEIEEKSITNIFDKCTMKEIYSIENNDVITKIMGDIGYNIGSCVGNILNILDVDNIVLSGDIIHSKIFKKQFKNGIIKTITTNFDSQYNLISSTLGDNLEILGPISLIMLNLFDNKKIIKI